MFDLGTQEQKEDMQEKKYTFEEHEEMSSKDLLSMEKEMLGIYISGHPLEKYRELIEKETTINSIDLRQIEEQSYTNIETENITEKSKFKDGQRVKYAGIITSIKKKYTKNNKIMAFVTVEDLYGTAEFIVFESTYMNCKSSLVEENIVIIDGRLSIREDDTPTIIASEIKEFTEKKQSVLVLNITDSSENEKDKLRGAIRYFSGDRNNINVYVEINGEKKSCGQIYLTNDILEMFKEIIGQDKVKIDN